jgi:hypothetical protein
MKQLSKTFRIGLLLSCLGVAYAARAGTVGDNFTVNHDYLTNGVAGTIWDGLYTGAGDFGNLTGGNDGQTLQCDANISSNGVFTLRTINSNWEGSDDDGFLLYKTVYGDFQAIVHMMTPYSATPYNCAGLMARAAGPGGNPFGGTENYVGWFRFDEFGFGNYARNTVNSGSSNQNPSDGVGADTYWIMLERVGNQFNTYYRATEPISGVDEVWNPTPANCNFLRDDLNGVPVQVGIMQATFSGNSPIVNFEKFSITGPSVTARAAIAAATGLTVTTNTDQNLNLSWTKGGGADGSVVVLRRNGVLKQQPAVGVTYTGSTNFTTGACLAVNTYVVYSGTGNSVTVAGPPGTYTVAVYSYTGSGAAINYNSSPATATASINPASLGVALTAPANLTLFSAGKCTVQANYSNGAFEDVTTVVTYTSSAPAAVSVAAGGALQVSDIRGPVTITATWNGNSDSKIVNAIDPAAATLTHRYSFKEPSGTSVADSVGGATGTLIGAGATLDGTKVTLINGGAPADSYVSLPGGLMTSYDSMTWELWVTPDDLSGYRKFVDFNSPDPAVTGTPSNTVYFAFDTASTSAGVGYNWNSVYDVGLGGNTRPAVGQKAHVVFTTYGPSRLGVIYVNGQMLAVNRDFNVPSLTAAFTPKALGPLPNSWLGRSGYDGEAGFNGSYDEFRIYNGSLSPLQVWINANRGPGQSDPVGALQSVTLTVTNHNMQKLSRQSVGVAATWVNATNIPIATWPETTYTSSDPSIISVDAQGNLSTHTQLGTATITASYGGLSSSVPVNVVPPPPFDTTGWNYNTALSIIGYNQSETLLNFPVLVKLDTTISGFAYSQFASSLGADLRFTDGEGAELKYEIEKWDTLGTSFVWVQLPELKKGSQIFAYWGKAGAPAPAYTTDGSTWSGDFTGVWHMQTNYVTDATSHGYNASAIVVEAAVTTTDGMIGAAQNYDAGTGNGATSVGNIKPGSTVTLSAWVNLAEQNREGIFMCKDGNFFFWQQGTNLRHERSPWGSDTFIPVSASGGAAPSPGSWFHIAGTINGTTEAIYINGQLRGTWTKTPDSINDNQWQIGGVSGGRIMNGVLDECRVESVARSSAWIWACWKNQSAPEQFMTISSVYQVSAPLAVVAPQFTFEGTSATLGGRVVSDGGAGVTSWGTVYGGAPAPTGNSLALTGSARAPFSFTQVRPGFNPATHYYFRAWASNSLSGKVFSPDGEFFTKPLPASAVTFAAIYNNQMTISWTPSAGSAGYLVVMKAASAPAIDPADGVVYTTSPVFGAGQDVGGGSYAVYSGSGASVAVNNLTAATTYYVAVYAFAGIGSSTSYGTPATGNQATASSATSGGIYVGFLKASSPAALWPLYDLSGTVETESLGLYNGTYSGAFALGESGPRPSTLAAKFDGNTARAKVPYAKALNNPNPAAPFSVVGWFKPSASGGLWSPISSGHISTSTDVPNRSGWLVYQSATAWEWRMYSGAGTAVSLDLIGTTAPVGGTWYYLALVWDGANASIYVNGVLDAGPTAGPGFVPNAGPGLSDSDGQFTLGARSDDAYAWSGWVSEVAQYSRALTASEIGWFYVAPALTATPTASGLSLSWTLGVLQQADTANGHYTDISGAASPWPVTPSAEKKFYRLRNN